MTRHCAALLLCLAFPALAADDEARRSFLAAEVAAARSKDFYLVFDAAGPAIDLKIEGARAHRYPLDAAEFGQARLAGAGQRRWPAVAFTLVSEVPEPDRPVLRIQTLDEEQRARDAKIKEALARGQKPAGELSKTAGEQVAELQKLDDADAPLTYRLQFEPDLVLVVRGEPRGMDFGSRLRRARYALQDGWQGFGMWLGDRPIPARVVVYLPPEEARRLFKVLKPGIRLLVRTGD